MNTLVDKIADATAVDVWFDETKLYVRLIDGRELAVPLDWFPKLRDSSEEEKKDWRFIGRGKGIHWKAIDEDLSVAGLLRTK
ncbi:hypothetical protein AAE02nite_02930 [Adhaeribacter aerolatus]|uniref:DUF2442 domain-containing protein n=1 Tax=Adhaeribacter aerolatus TaxID=670289 RepID=A0A512ASE6_9BACT|nr:DUF2442 domain-containing protein [Adhaeribacter aerolatus]GEO02629.1 hypothetical protein AAE02nite_02930 [Adhaeribacter aerolatus]